RRSAAPAGCPQLDRGARAKIIAYVGIRFRQIRSPRSGVLIWGGHLGVEDTQPLIAELAVKQSGRLRQFLRARVRNTADIPDLIQEVFLRLMRVPSRETIRQPEAYIFTIARHAAQQHQLTSSRAGTLVELDEALGELLPGPEPDPVLAVSAEQCAAALQDALEEMSPKVRATFLLYRRDGLSMDEISERLGISRPMAKKYLVKALARLRERLRGLD
ncbi:MAG TPA: RNA polymerase sigma factor, partial [Steroidobacteraceae bacterium]